MTVSFEVAGVTKLADDLTKSPLLVRGQGRAFIGEGAADLAKAWKANAAETSGAHGRRYVAGIGWRWLNLSFGVSAEVGPLSGSQKDMSFEHGSSNQPPHLDGQRAAEDVAPRLLRRFDQLKVLQ